MKSIAGVDGDGGDAAPADPTSPTAPPVAADDPTRTSARADDGVACDRPRSDADRLPAPLQYRDPERYRILGEHGRGGLGRVLRARDKELGRDVAVKELLERGNTSELRFFREALITARLEHPGIVPVHEAGRWPDGTPFYAMKLVQGRPLRDLIDDCKNTEERLALIPHVVAVADAIAYAHDRKIIHRDLKPSNVIVGAYGETVVIDWGLAKDLTSEISDPIDDGPYRTPPSDGITVAGSVLGTPAYMAPEQATGAVGVDYRADVYALGTVLLHLVTGTIPRVVQPSGEDDWNEGLKDIPREVAAIICRAMAPSPDDRYPTARAFAGDLRAYQTGQRVRAHKYSLHEHFQRWVARHRVAVIAGALAALGVSVALAVGFTVAVRERDQAMKAEAREQERADDLLLQRAEALLPIDPTAAYELVHNNAPNARNQQRAAQIAADAMGRGTATYSFSPKIGIIAHLEWTPANKLLIRGTYDKLIEWQPGNKSPDRQISLATFSYSSADANRRWFAYQGSDAVIRLRNLQTGHESDLGHLDGTPWDLAVSPTGKYVAATASTGDIVLWSTSARRLRSYSRPPGVYQALRFSPDSSMLAACGRDGRLVVWSTETGDEVIHEKCDGLANIDYEFSRDNKSLLVGYRSGTINEIRIPAKGLASDVVLPIEITHGGITQIVAGPGVSAFVGTDTGELLFYDIAMARVVWRSQLASGVTRATYDEKNNIVFVGCSDGRIVMATGTGRLVGALQGHTARVSSISLSADSRWLASGSADNTIRIWSLPVPAVQSVQVASAPLFFVRFSPDGELVATESQDGTVSVCATKTLECTTTVAHDSLAYGLAWRLDGAALATTGWDGQLRIWNRASNKSDYFRLPAKDAAPYVEGFLKGDKSILLSFEGKRWEVRTIGNTLSPPILVFDWQLAVELSADGGRLATMNAAGALSIWDTSQPTPQLLSTTQLGGGERTPPAVTLSRSGRFAVVELASGAGYFAKISPRGDVSWNVIPSLGATPPWTPTFSPDEQDLAISYSDGSIVMIRTATGERTIRQPFASSAAGLWMGNTRLIALTGDGYVWIYDRPSGAQCVTHVEREEIMGAALSPDEDTIAIAGESGRLHFYNIQTCRWAHH